MKLNIEQVTQESRFWNQINALAKEAFPPAEYLAPSKLVEMGKADSFDFWALSDRDSFVGFMVVQTYKNLAYLFFQQLTVPVVQKGMALVPLKH